MASADPAAHQPCPTDGAEWVELFVKEMMSASNMDDAKVRASRVLEALEKSICARASTETAKSFLQVIFHLYFSLSYIVIAIQVSCKDGQALFLTVLSVCLIFSFPGCWFVRDV